MKIPPRNQRARKAIVSRRFFLANGSIGITNSQSDVAADLRRRIRSKIRSRRGNEADREKLAWRFPPPHVGGYNGTGHLPDCRRAYEIE